jgi:hypothetical protein
MSDLTLDTVKKQKKLLELGHLSVIVSCTIFQKTKMTCTVQEGLPIWATGGEYTHTYTSI